MNAACAMVTGGALAVAEVLAFATVFFAATTLVAVLDPAAKARIAQRLARVRERLGV